MIIRNHWCNYTQCNDIFTSGFTSLRWRCAFRYYLRYHWRLLLTWFFTSWSVWIRTIRFPWAKEVTFLVTSHVILQVQGLQNEIKKTVKSISYIFILRTSHQLVKISIEKPNFMIKSGLDTIFLKILKVGFFLKLWATELCIVHIRFSYEAYFIMQLESTFCSPTRGECKKFF